MKIIFIDPPTSFEQMYGDWDLSGVDTYCPPLGLLYIASFVRKNGHTPYVIDMKMRDRSLQEISKFILSVKPDIVGISSMTINILNANKIAEQLKEGGLEAPIVVGGAHITAAPQETLRRFKSIDYGVIGEGEITFLELIEKKDKKEPLSNVRGIIWRNSDGQIVMNPPRPLIQDLDILPFPAWDSLPDFPHGQPVLPLTQSGLPAASIMTSRGCPFHCTFCDNLIFGSVVRHHSAEYTLNMIRHLKDNYGVKDLMVLDDNFILDKTKLFKICDRLSQERLNLSWYCMGHAKFVTEDRLKKMVQAGCWFIEIGIESGCDRILRLLKKNTTKSEIASAVKKARDAGLKVKGNFIFGLPTETKESLEETIQFATSIDLSYFQQNFLTIWPGCELSKNASQYGLVESEWNKLAHQRITFVPYGLTREDLMNASRDAFRRFYLRPKIIFAILISLNSFRAIRCAMVAFIAFLKTIFRKKTVSFKI